MPRTQADLAISALIEHAKARGEEVVGSEGKCAYALGYVGSSIESALGVLTDYQRQKVVEAIIGAIAWSQGTRTVE